MGHLNLTWKSSKYLAGFWQVALTILAETYSVWKLIRLENSTWIWIHRQSVLQNFPDFLVFVLVTPGALHVLLITYLVTSIMSIKSSNLGTIGRQDGKGYLEGLVLFSTKKTRKWVNLVLKLLILPWFIGPNVCTLDLLTKVRFYQFYPLRLKCWLRLRVGVDRERVRYGVVGVVLGRYVVYFCALRRQVTSKFKKNLYRRPQRSIRVFWNPLWR